MSRVPRRGPKANKDAFCGLPHACATQRSQRTMSRPHESSRSTQSVLVEQLAMKAEQSEEAVPQSKKDRDASSSSVIRMQTKSPAQEEHVRPRVTLEPLALKDQHSHTAMPQSKRNTELPPRPPQFIRTQTNSAAGDPSRLWLCQHCARRREVPKAYAVKRDCIGCLEGGLRRHV